MNNSWVMIRSKLGTPLAFFVSMSLCLFPQSYGAASGWEGFTQTVETIDKRDGSLRSRSEVLMSKDPAAEGVYHLFVNGKGHFSGYLNVTWESHAVLRKDEDLISIEKTTTSIYSGKQLLAQYYKSYDHVSKRATWEKHDALGKIVSSRQFPIKGPISDDVTMVYLFRDFIGKNNPSGTNKFYLLTNEPKLYHVLVRNLGEDSVGPKGIQQRTDKYQLYADMGPLTKIALRVVPPTYLWMAQAGNGQWLKYEGMETGYETANIESIVISDSRWAGSGGAAVP